TAFATEACEIQLVQERRIERAQFLALEPADHIARRGLEIERGELLRDGVQAPERAAIVVFVVALDQLEGQGVQQPRPAVYRCNGVAHGNLHESYMLKDKRTPWCWPAARRSTAAAGAASKGLSTSYKHMS